MNNFYKQLIFITLGCAIITAGALTIRAVANRGAYPIAWWKFDEGYASTTYDTSGSNDGTMTGGVQWANEPECKTGKCLSFDGVNDYVDLDDTPFDFDISDNFTIELWAKWTSTASNLALFSKQDIDEPWYGYGLYVNYDTAGDVKFYFIGSGNDRALSYDGDYNDGNWHHISVVHNGTTKSYIYVDGSEVNSSTDSLTGSMLNNNNLEIGSREHTASWYFDGKIDDFRIYDYARSATQIKADYLASAEGKGAAVCVSSAQEVRDASEGLVAYWKFDETALNGCGTAQDACDDSGGGNHLAAIADAAPTSTANYGYAATFDGTGDYYCSDPDDDGACEDDTDLAITNMVTLEVWIKSNAAQAGANQVVAGLGGSYLLNFDHSNANYKGVFALYLDNTLYDSGGPVTISENIWHHFVGVYDGTYIKTYLDGQLAASNNVGSHTITRLVNYAFTVGGVTYAAEEFTGFIDDVKIYNKARSASQIRKDYLTGPPPVAHWKMDENQSSVINDTSGSNTGALTMGGAGNLSTTTAWVKGKYGSALSFDGVDDYVDLGNNVDITTEDFTIEAWVKTGTDNEYIVDKRSDANTGYGSWTKNTTGVLIFKFGDGIDTYQVNGTTNIADNSWHHIAMIADKDSEAYVYIDGADDSASRAGTLANVDSITNASSLLFGNSNVTDAFFNGSIDDVRIYNYARTQRQIMEDMNAGHPAIGSPIGSYVGYWKFDEGYASTTYDASINNNDGTLTGGVQWTTDGKFGKALDFDGIDDYVVVSDNNSLDLTTFTISAWIRRDSDHADDIYRTILAKGAGSGVAYDNNYKFLVFDSDQIFANKLYCYAGGGKENSTDFGIFSSFALTDGTFYHVACVYDLANDRAQMFIDGELDVTINGGLVTPTTTAHELYIGQWKTTVQYGEWDGIIDDVKIYPFALTPEEVLLEYNSGATLKLGSLSAPPTGGAGAGTSTDSALIEYCVPGDIAQCDSPVAHWKFDERGGSTIYDTAGSNDGDLNLDSTPATTSAWKSAGQCHSGSCLSFDGSDDFVDLSSSVSTLNFTEPATFSAWVNSTNDSGQVIYFIGDAGEAIDRMAVYIGDGVTYTLTNELITVAILDNGSTEYILGYTTATRTELFDGSWHNLSVVWDGSSTKIYLDGVSKTVTTGGGSDTGDYGGIGGADSVAISSQVVSDSRLGYFNGLIDDVRIYNYARTPAQIAWEYNRGGPIGHWTMDSVSYAVAASSTIEDASGQANDGTFVGEVMNNGTTTATTKPTWKPNRDCKYGTCLDFDGSDDYVDAGNQTGLSFLGDFSASFWMRPDSVSGNDNIFGRTQAAGDNRAYYVIRNTDEIRLYISDDGTTWTSRVTSDANLLAGTWCHIAVAYDASDGSATFYKDGALLTSTGVLDNSIHNAAEDADFWIGYGDSGVGYFEGSLDEFRIYDTLLNATQVAAIYNNNDRSAGASLEGNLVGEWRFDEGGGDEMVDTHYQRYGKYNYALEFDGTDDYVGRASATGLPQGNAAFSISAWIYSTNPDHQISSFDSVEDIVSWGIDTQDDWNLLTFYQGKIFHAFNNNDLQGTTITNTNTWYHVAVTYDGAIRKLYLDGELDASATPERTPTVTGSDLYIGHSTRGTYLFQGLLDDVKIFNYALTEHQIRTEFNSGAARFGPSSGLP